MLMKKNINNEVSKDSPISGSLITYNVTVSDVLSTI